MVSGLREFYLQKRIQLVTFLADKKLKKRSPKLLQKFDKMRRLTEMLGLLFTQPLDEEVRFQIFFEICYKFGFINCPNVNETFLRHYPNYQNTIII